MTSRGAKYWESGAIPLIGPDILGDIIREVADVGVVVAEDGKVLSVLSNPGFDMGEELARLEGKPFKTALTVESVPKFETRLARFLGEEEPVRPVEINHKSDSRQGEFPMRYSFHRIGPDGAVLMLGRDLRPVAEMQQQLVKAQLALERDYEHQREFDTRFRVLMNHVRDGVAFVSTHTGKIVAVNPIAAGLLGLGADSLEETELADHVDRKDAPGLIERLVDQATNQTGAPVAVTARHSGEALQILPTLFRSSGERNLMCLMARSGDAATLVQSCHDQLQDLFRLAPEGILFTDPDGRILSANDGFLNLVGAASSTDLRGADFGNFLHRGSVDMRVMTENAERAGRMRLYATRIAGDYGAPRNVEISVTVIGAGEANVFAFVIREATRTENGLTPIVGQGESMQSVIELVGSATLKEIVAETTAVVEKMCIETAVELTMNNRVAAAEMLGLSRQSLYVKLRKFGLLERD